MNLSRYTLRIGTKTPLLTTISVLAVLLLLLSTTAYAQDGSGEPLSLFSTAPAVGAQAMSAVGDERLETLQQDAPTQSVRLVQMVDDLSQRRSLVIKWNGRVVEPDVQPVFVRTPAAEGKTQGETQDRIKGTTTLFIERDTIKAVGEASFAWSGTVYARRGDRTQLGEVNLFQDEDRQVTGTIRVEGDFYAIRPLGGGLHALVEDDESKYESGGDPLNDGKGDPRDDGGAAFEPSLLDVSPPEFLLSASHSSGAAFASAERECTAPAASEGVNLETTGMETERAAMAPCFQVGADVLVVYTSRAASGRNMNGIVNLAIQEAEDAYENSNIDGYWYSPGSVDLNLVHSQQVTFSETPNMTDDMNRLVTNSTIQSLRNQYNADIVVLITDNVYPNILGRAREIRAEAPDAYAIVEVSAASGSGWTFVHEVGHLQGAQHNPEHACALGASCDAEGDLFPNAFGHYFTASGNLRRTVMADNRVTGYSRILYFSNPSVRYNGTATGTSSRNNAAALKTTSDAVEYFRTSNRLEAKISPSGDYNSGVRHFDANPCGGTNSYTYEWRISYYGSGNYGSPVSTQEMFTHVFPNGTHVVKLTVRSGSQTAIATVGVVIDCQPGYQCGSQRVASAPETISAEQALASAKFEEAAAPEQLALHAATPNPVQTSTEIRYDLPEAAEVELTVYDLMGREVRRLATGSHGRGSHRVQWDTAALPSGVYLVRLQDGRRQLTQRITVVK